MRRFLSICAFTLLALTAAKAQNVQFHYDFGKHIYSKDFADRSMLTTTVEMFKPDKWGSTFFFIDMDHTSKGVQLSYWEIARELKFWEGPLSLHLEYNGGNSNAFSLSNAYLGGLTYTYNNASFSKGFTLSTLYKYIQEQSKPHNFQLTGTWYVNFGKNGIGTFMGFADFWREKQVTGAGDYVFLAEPQLWLNLNKIDCVDDNFNLSIGSELELRNDFIISGFYAIPTLAVKWSF